MEFSQKGSRPKGTFWTASETKKQRSNQTFKGFDHVNDKSVTRHLSASYLQLPKSFIQIPLRSLHFSFLSFI